MNLIFLSSFELCYTQIYNRHTHIHTHTYIFQETHISTPGAQKYWKSSKYKNYVKFQNDSNIKCDKDLIRKKSGNPRQLWKIVNSQLGNKSKKDGNISEIYNENKEIIED